MLVKVGPICSSKMNLIPLILFLYYWPVNSQAGVTNFSQEEIRFFRSMDLCNHFGGQCGEACPFRFIRHKWGVPLCPTGPSECCIGPPRQSEVNAPAPTPVSTTESVTTELSSTTPEASTSARPASCGVNRQASNTGVSKRIVGGHVSTSGSWPWLVALRSMLGAHVCSGAVVSSRWIVTAAHCFKHVTNPSLWRVRVGEFDLLSADKGEREMQLDRIVLHPQYRVRQPNRTNQSQYAQDTHDIALIHLTQNAGVEPICLSANQRQGNESHDEGSYPVGACWVAGWGATRDSEVQDQTLRQVTGEVVDHQRCGAMWGAQFEPDTICFGNGTYGPCAGDSGGPMSCQREGRFYLTGVVSWGTEDCNVTGYPSVLTSVDPYQGWLRQTMELQL